LGLTTRLQGEDSSSSLSSSDSSQANAKTAATAVPNAAFAYARARFRINMAIGDKETLASLEHQGVRPSNPSALEDLDSAMYSADLAELQRRYQAHVALLKNNAVGTDAYIASVRMNAISGYYLAWRLVDDGNLDEAKQVISDLGRLYAPYAATSTPALRLPLARYHWLLGHYYWRLGNKAGENLEGRIASEMVTDITAFPPDYAALALMKARILWDLAKTTDTDAQAKACDLFRSVVLIRRTDIRAQYGLVTCRISAAQAKLAAGHPIEALALLEVTLQNFQSATQEQSDKSVYYQMYEVILLNAMATITNDSSINIPLKNYKISALRRFIEIINGRKYAQNSFWQAREIYGNFSSLTDSDIASYRSKNSLISNKIIIFSDIASAVEASRQAFPQSPSFAYISLDARTKVITALLDQERSKDALTESDIAMAIYAESPILARLTDYDGDGEIECMFLKQRVDLQLKLAHNEQAEVTYGAMSRSCGAWAKKYPWDFYVRSPFVAASNAIGKMRYDTNRFGEAVPLLTYASNWGDSKASGLLADMYRDGQGVAADDSRANALNDLAKLQTMKRFTVPTDFSGKKYPFYVYALQYGSVPRCKLQAEPLDPSEFCAGYNGIDDQALWVQEARGGTVPADVMESFQKLDTIARENNVSFPDLAVYALGAAQADTGGTEANAQAIYPEMQKTGFWRNPNWSSDGAGVALGGYDVVSYSKESKPLIGKADTFALWDGAVWLFANADNKAAFLRNPYRYAPQYGGFASMEMSTGKITGSTYTEFISKDGKIYLFDSESEKQKWAEDAGALARKAELYWLNADPDHFDSVTTLGKLILKLGKVRAPTEIEKDRASLPRRSAIVTLMERPGIEKQLLVSALGNRSWTYLLLGRGREALADTDRALKLDPSQAWIIGNRGEALLMTGRVEEAGVLFRTIATAKGPDGKREMCELMDEDFKILRANGLAPGEAIDRAWKASACVLAPSTPAALPSKP
jgi:YHS domain-containing protein